MPEPSQAATTFNERFGQLSFEQQRRVMTMFNELYDQESGGMRIPASMLSDLQEAAKFKDSGALNLAKGWLTGEAEQHQQKADRAFAEFDKHSPGSSDLIQQLGQNEPGLLESLANLNMETDADYLQGQAKQWFMDNEQELTGYDAGNQGQGQNVLGSLFQGGMKSPGVSVGLPLLGGLMSMLYGMRSGNNLAGMAGLAATVGGLYSAYNQYYKPFQAMQNPELLSGVLRGDQAAKQQYQQYAQQTQPVRNIMSAFTRGNRGTPQGTAQPTAVQQAAPSQRAPITQNTGVSGVKPNPVATVNTPSAPNATGPASVGGSAGPSAPSTPKQNKTAHQLDQATVDEFHRQLKAALGQNEESGEFPKVASNLYQSLNAHFDLARMKRDVLTDPGLDSIKQSRLVTAINSAARQLKTTAPSVGGFANVSAPIIGFAAGVGLGALSSASPLTRETIKQIGGGLVSGAQGLGLLPDF